MRLRAGSHWLYPLMLATAVILGPLLSGGCGGSSSSSPFTPTPTSTPTGGPTGTPTPTPTPTVAPPAAVTTKVLWAPRSRQQPGVDQVNGPSSALSVSFTLVGANAGSDVVWGGDRDPKFGSGGVQAFTSSQTVRPGIYPLVVRFFGNNGQQNPLVGTAAASATVQVDGTISTTISTFTTITSVEVAPNQTLGINETKTLSFTAGNNVLLYSPKDKDGNIVAITPGSATLVLVKSDSTVPGQPSAAVQADSLTGLAPQRATVRVQVDYKESPETAVLIRSNVTLAVSPPNATLSLLEGQTFTATLQNDNPTVGGVTWSVLQGDTAGTIDANGVFKATRLEGNFTIRATSKFDPNVFVDTPVTVASQVAVTVSPANPAPISFNGGQQKFTATVSRVPADQDAGVTWSVKESTGGTISADGLYIAPAQTGVYTIVATSNFDTRKTAEIKVTVSSLATVTITSAVPDPLSIKSTLQFTAKVDGIPGGGDPGVTWSVVEPGGGTISATGLYTSPATPGDYTIVARSKFDTTKTAQAVVKVRSSVGVTVTPNPATISIKDKVTFNATVTGVPTGGDTTVTWSIKETGGDFGSIDANTGVYTAPAKAVPSLTILATSKFDPNVKGSAAVSVQSFVVVKVPADTASISIKDKRTFTATVEGVPAGGDTGVTWSIQNNTGNLGSIDPNTGVYTSPATPVTPVVLLATSKFDPNAAPGKITVTVASFVTVAIAPKPLPAPLPLKGTQTFVATVGGVPAGGDTGVIWTIERGPNTPAGTDIGSITQSGVYTAPPATPTRPGINVVVRATSKFDTNVSDTVAVLVKSNVDVTVLPNDNPTHLPIGAQRLFTATVTGVPTGGDTGVTWKVISGSGSITAGGVYLAPNVKDPNVIIRATSKYDPNATFDVKVSVESGDVHVKVN